MIVDAALFTTRLTFAVAVVYVLVSVGVNVTDKVSVPVAGNVPAAGLYAKLPGTDAVALS